MSLLKWLDHIDKVLFVLINHDADHFFLDDIMLVLRNPYTWIPLYAFMLYYVLRKGKSNAWLLILLSGLTVATTDILAAELFKPMFERLRPCYDPELSFAIRGLVDCGGLFSMPSNHAANHVGLAAFWYFSFKKISGKKWNWVWIWAAAICYAQIYVGKHYPFDMLAGALLGFLTGLGMSRLLIYLGSRLSDRPDAFVFLFKKPAEKPVEI